MNKCLKCAYKINFRFFPHISYFHVFVMLYSEINQSMKPWLIYVCKWVLVVATSTFPTCTYYIRVHKCDGISRRCVSLPPHGPDHITIYRKTLCSMLIKKMKRKNAYKMTGVYFHKSIREHKKQQAKKFGVCVCLQQYYKSTPPYNEFRQFFTISPHHACKKLLNLVLF